MNLWGLARRNLLHHAPATAVTVAAVALASGLLMAVAGLATQSRRAFVGGPVGYDAVLGARGSPLQLVLNTVYHLDTSPGNIPWSMYEALRGDPRVALAVPYAVGDNYRGFRLVGTTEEIFTTFEYERGRRFRFAHGRPFDPSRREAVVGALAARRAGLREGDEFNPYHGVVFDASHRHAERYRVSGVLAPTNTPSDRVIWIPLDGLFRLGGHVLRGGGDDYIPSEGRAIPDEFKELSAVMLKLRAPQVGFQLDQTINRQGRAATLAWPIGAVMAGFLDRLSWVTWVLTLTALLTALVAAAALLAALQNALAARRREFAILRALGARRRTVFALLMCEASAVAAVGSVLGYGVYAAVFAAAAAALRSRTGVSLDGFAFHPALLAAPMFLTVLGAVAGLVPAISAYRTAPADHLAPVV